MNIKNIAENCEMTVSLNQDCTNDEMELFRNLCNYYQLFNDDEETINMTRIDSFLEKADRETNEFQRAFAGLLRDVLSSCEDGTAFESEEDFEDSLEFSG